MLYVSGALAALISAVIGAVVGAVIGYLSKRRLQEQAEDDLLLCMSRATLFSHYQDVLARGHSVPQEIEVYEPMYRAYNARGGDGVIDRLHSQVEELPIKPE